jgi:CRP-like cAMP-binding protein
MAKIKPLRQSPVCQGLTFREIASVAQVVEEKKLKNGDILGASESRGLVIVAKGSLQVRYTFLTKDSLKKSPIELILREDEYFGELSLLSGRVLSAEELPLKVVAKGDCQILRLVSERFEELLEDEPAIGLKIIKNISGNLQSRLLHYQKFIQRMITTSGENLPA